MLIYPSASGTPTKYVDPGMADYGYCAYDSAGNLYLDGFSVPKRRFQLAELPKGKKTFTNIKLSERLRTSSALGAFRVGEETYVVIGNGRFAFGDHVHIQIYRIDVTGSTGKSARTTSLKRAHSLRDFQFWIQGSTIISPYGSRGAGGGDHKMDFGPTEATLRNIRDREGPWAVTGSLTTH